MRPHEARLTKVLLCICQTTVFFSQQLPCAGSKNPKKLELGGILCRSPSLTSYSKAGQASEFEQASQILVQTSSEYCQGQRLFMFPAQTVPVFRCAFCEEFFPCFPALFPRLHSMTTAFCLFTVHSLVASPL